MAGWKQVINTFADRVDDRFDQLKNRLAQRLGNQDPLMIMAYRGFGTPQKLYLKGRVLEDEGITPATENDDLWDNLVNMYRRFESDEVPFAQVRARFNGQEMTVTADKEGFFDLEIDTGGRLPDDKLWQQVELELVSPASSDGKPVQAEAQVLVPQANTEFGVISDIDDTVLLTDATHLLRMARNVFLSNSRSRLPFKGVAAFYRALLHGASGKPPHLADVNEGINPIFYVSSSPWNIYDLLSDFFHLQNIPLGPIMFLRDWGVSEREILPTGHRTHKVESIKRVLDLYANLSFILVGDSGQEDPEIYAEIVGLYPKRILACYIRNVSTNLKRPEAIRTLAKRVAEAGSTLILADDTVPMAEHAISMGWIPAAALPEIKEEKRADEAPPTPVEKLLGEEEKPEEAPTVVVEGKSEAQTKEAVDKGAIETALDEEAAGQKPPTVIVEGDPEE